MHDSSILCASNGVYTDIVGKVRIGNNCFIGCGSIILPGVTLPDFTIVAAGSVVTKSIDQPGFIIGGNPAKIIGTVQEYIERNSCHAVNLHGKDFDERQQALLEFDNYVEREKL